MVNSLIYWLDIQMVNGLVTINQLNLVINNLNKYQPIIIQPVIVIDHYSNHFRFVPGAFDEILRFNTSYLAWAVVGRNGFWALQNSPSRSIRAVNTPLKGKEPSHKTQGKPSSPVAEEFHRDET